MFATIEIFDYSLRCYIGLTTDGAPALTVKLILDKLDCNGIKSDERRQYILACASLLDFCLSLYL